MHIESEESRRGEILDLDDLRTRYATDFQTGAVVSSADLPPALAGLEFYLLSINGRIVLRQGEELVIAQSYPEMEAITDPGQLPPTRCWPRSRPTAATSAWSTCPIGIPSRPSRAAVTSKAASPPS
ncbi:MAG: hypothetical protein IMY75_01945 [Chloroflexi bacterium]|nr:hypothetical protein [Chloroflexota bacterium]